MRNISSLSDFDLGVSVGQRRDVHPPRRSLTVIETGNERAKQNAPRKRDEICDGAALEKIGRLAGFWWG